MSITAIDHPVAPFRENAWLKDPTFLAWAMDTDPQILDDMRSKESLDRQRWHTDAFQEGLRGYQSKRATQRAAGDDYQILGLAGFSGKLTRAALISAYRKQAKKWHPDHGGSDTLMKKLNAAYNRVLLHIPKDAR